MWCAELGNFDYDIKHLPGKSNLAPDALSRAYSIIPFTEDLSQLHNKLGHPGISRLNFVHSKNLPFSTEDVKKGLHKLQNLPRVETSVLQKTT